MNPMLEAALTAIVRALLVGMAGWLVKHGVWTEGDATGYVAAGALAIVTLGWSIYQKYKDRLTLNTALMLAGKTEDAVRADVADPTVPTPTATTPTNTIPGVPK